MNDEPRQKLHKLIVDYGRSLCNDPNRCEALLKDHCGVHKREIFVLVSALKKKVPDDLLNSSAGVPQEIVIGRLCKRLEDELAFTSEASHWAVESWAMALGYILGKQKVQQISNEDEDEDEVNTEKTVNAAFMKSLTPSPALATIVGAGPLPRTEVVSKLWIYIKKNKLQDAVNKRVINADAKLLSIFGKQQVSMFEMAGLIGKHLK
jgi:hypothetical protein